MRELDHGGKSAVSVPVVFSHGRHAPDDPPPIEPSRTLDTAETETRHYRHDGWTPAARAAFLDMLAKSGIVTDACREAQRSAQAAYALRNRDALFAAGWDTALSLSRARLADEVFHRAVHGTVDQVWKDGAIVAERHHHDNRLSIAVLNRLDARCDRAERIGAPTVRLAAQWDAYLAALAEDRIADAQALLDPPPPPPGVPAILGQGSDAMLIHQFHQLRSGKALDADAAVEAEDEDDDAPVWIQNHTWRTNFPPPRGFLGDEDGEYGDDDYNRQCTPDEWTVLDARFPDAFVDNRAAALAAHEAKRDLYFSPLTEVEEEEEEKKDAPSSAHPEPVEGSPENLTPAHEPADGSPKAQTPAHPEPVEGPPPPTSRPSTSSGGALLDQPTNGIPPGEAAPAPDSS